MDWRYLQTLGTQRERSTGIWPEKLDAELSRFMKELEQNSPLTENLLRLRESFEHPNILPAAP